MHVRLTRQFRRRHGTCARSVPVRAGQDLHDVEVAQVGAPG